MNVSNTNYRAIISAPYSLKELQQFFPDSKLYSHKPKMLRIRTNNVSILVFNNLKVRIMGRGDEHQNDFDKFLNLIPHVKIILPLQLMSFTAVYKLPYRINIQNLDPNHFYVDLETFPAAILRHNGNENVNIFVSGKVVITGLKQIFRYHELIKQVITFQNDRTQNA